MLDSAETDKLFANGVLAITENGLVSVQVVMATPPTFRIDGETENTLEKRESYQVCSGDRSRNNTYLSQPVTEN